ncbi:hypothetical protein BJY52DRAFT_1376534 [Lactarius psammicola]|nr:hypothetical protein BJY52DRAFT_1376534 [Lactarius psammicola]
MALIGGGHGPRAFIDWTKETEALRKRILGTLMQSHVWRRHQKRSTQEIEIVGVTETPPSNFELTEGRIGKFRKVSAWFSGMAGHSPPEYVAAAGDILTSATDYGKPPGLQELSAGAATGGPQLTASPGAMIPPIASANLTGNIIHSCASDGLSITRRPQTRVDGRNSPLAQEDGTTPWVPATHPDGALYFFDKEMVHMLASLQTVRVTNPHWRDTTWRENIRLIEGPQVGTWHYAHRGRADTAVLLLRLSRNRCLFRFETYYASHVISELSPAQVKHQLMRFIGIGVLYRTHSSLFSAVFDGPSRHLEPAVYDELVGILSHGVDTTDVMTSTLPYDDDIMQKTTRHCVKANGTLERHKDNKCG